MFMVVQQLQNKNIS